MADQVMQEILAGMGVLACLETRVGLEVTEHRDHQAVEVSLV